MSSPLRIRECLRSFLFQTPLDDIQRITEEDLRVVEVEIPFLEILEAEAPPIPEALSSQQFPQKELVAGITELLPSILKTPTPNEEWLFVALTLLESVEKTQAKFYFPPEMHLEASPLILQWAQAYQEQHYMLSPLMATVHWGIIPQ